MIVFYSRPHFCSWFHLLDLLFYLAGRLDLSLRFSTSLMLEDRLCYLHFFEALASWSNLITLAIHFILRLQWIDLSVSFLFFIFFWDYVTFILSWNVWILKHNKETLTLLFFFFADEGAKHLHHVILVPIKVEAKLLARF